MFRVRLTCFHRVCRTINARPRNNNGINHPSRPARCLGPRSILSPPLVFPRDRYKPRDRIPRKIFSFSRVMEIPCTDPAINLFTGRVCKYPRNITPPPRKSRANTSRLPYGFISHLLIPRKKERKEHLRCRGCILRDTRRRCKAPGRENGGEKNLLLVVTKILLFRWNMKNVPFGIFVLKVYNSRCPNGEYR